MAATNGPRRKRPQSSIETSVLTKSARRCALCYLHDFDFSEKDGQIAHLDQDPSNNSEDNLAWLCQKHHSRYDSSTSQHKNYTLHEVKVGREQIHQEVLLRRQGGLLDRPFVATGHAVEIANPNWTCTVGCKETLIRAEGFTELVEPIRLTIKAEHVESPTQTLAIVLAANALLTSVPQLTRQNAPYVPLSTSRLGDANVAYFEVTLNCDHGRIDETLLISPLRMGFMGQILQAFVGVYEGGLTEVPPATDQPGSRQTYKAEGELLFKEVITLGEVHQGLSFSCRHQPTAGISTDPLLVRCSFLQGFPLAIRPAEDRHVSDQEKLPRTGTVLAILRRNIPPNYKVLITLFDLSYGLTSYEAIAVAVRVKKPVYGQNWVGPVATPVTDNAQWLWENRVPMIELPTNEVAATWQVRAAPIAVKPIEFGIAIVPPPGAGGTLHADFAGLYAPFIDLCKDSVTTWASHTPRLPVPRFKPAESFQSVVLARA